ncbi:MULTISPECIES: hypothetical protein [Pseudomonas]|jgi:NAD(P)-dependent dehydrogenase (short-subunit alcohol dehydrogenase family)|uniref:Short-chain dehydrogenase n=1 Tax=Pseudomonas lutea TaxID=243924 RepID=A0A9X8MGK7_9PSED|nr:MULTISPECIES: hypothetical protein [Pseudomonas]SER26650.1 hypothetical protein SAMN05216409_11561 [Pseudomonas lutea]
MEVKPPAYRPGAIVIGASSGMGEALARRLVTEGWRVGLAEELNAFRHSPRN